MGSTKRIQYEQYHIDIANAYKALGHPARIRILELLIKNGRLNSLALSYELQLHPSTISHHLNILYLNHIVGYEVNGKECFNAIHPEYIDFIENHINWLNKTAKNQIVNYKNVYFKPLFHSELWSRPYEQH